MKTGCFGLSFVLSLVILLLLTACNLRLYTPIPPVGEPLPPDHLAQLAYLRGRLDDGSAREMQQLFPEGYFFSYALYGLAWVDVGLQTTDPAIQNQALTEARWALTFLDSPEGAAVFPAGLNPPYGMFYQAWRAYLLTGIVLLQPAGGQNPAELSRLLEQCQLLADVLTHSPTPFVASYTNQAWPVDTFPAVVALRGCDEITGQPTFAPVIEQWLEQVLAHLDPQWQLVPHRTQADSAEMVDGVRATSQTLILRFLQELDPEVAQEHYARFRQEFVVTRLNIPGVKEFPTGRERPGDVDSGPLLLGVSLSATAVMMGTARVYGDTHLLTILGQAGEALALPLHWGGQKSYGLGLLPIGDAFAVWSKGAVSWFGAQPAGVYLPILPPNWRLTFHLLTLVLWSLWGRWGWWWWRSWWQSWSTFG
jgi:hypothetical protein